MAKNHMKKCSPSLAIKEMKIITTLKIHVTLLEWLPLRTQTTNICKNMGEEEPSYTAGGIIYYYSHCGK
jgi:hypothetical protein